MTLKAFDVAAQTFTAQRVGAGRTDEVGAILATALTCSLACGAALSLIGVLWPVALMSLVSTDAEVVSLGARYLIFRYFGLLPLLVFFMLRGVFDGIGWTRVGMVVGIGMNLLNVLLNWVLIFGKLGAPPLGVAGAALASSVSGVVAAGAILAFGLRSSVRKRFRFFARGNLQPSLLGPFLRVGWPPAIQALGVIVAFLLFFFVLGKISTMAVAAGNIVLRIASLSLMAGIGISVAVQTLVGQALGAGDRATAVRAGWSGVALALLLMGGLGLLFTLIPETLLRAFSANDRLVATGIPILRLTGLAQLLAAVGAPLGGALRGAGATHQVMAVDIFVGFGLLAPCAYLFGIALDGGLIGAWLGLLVWFFLYAAGVTVLFVRGRWQYIDI
jgi:putative MATE family efflux protein